MIKVFTDGASRSNPGLASCAYVLYEGDKIMEEYSVFLGIRTNNFAEYKAVCCALEKCIQLNYLSIQVYCDSLLVVNQCNHLWKVKSQDLYPLYQEVMKYIPVFKSIQFLHIPREKNKYADQLCNVILDKVHAEIRH